MSYLTEKDILALLDSMDPQEILKKHSHELDETGKKFLAELEEDIQSGEAIFEAYGREFREGEEHIKVPKLSLAEKKQSSPKKPHKKGIQIPYWAMVAAAAAAVFTLVIMIKSIPDPYDFSIRRSGSDEHKDLEALDQKLLELLIERGELLLELGKRENGRQSLIDARNNLLLAYELDPKNTTVLAALSRTYEQLGDKQKAEAYFEEWQKARDEADNKD